MHSFSVFIHIIIIFQALGVLIMSCGLKGTVKTISKFPPFILTPIFSIWTIGPVMSKKSFCGNNCNNAHQKLGVSICLTWINLLLTLASGFAHAIWNTVGEFWPESDFISKLSFFQIFSIFSCPCLAIAMIFLILLQCLDKCPGCCCPCLPCCKSNCYPVTQYTYLDVNNLDIIITQEDIELGQF